MNDNEAGEFATETITQSLADDVSIYMFGFFILPLLRFRWLSIKKQKKVKRQ